MNKFDETYKKILSVIKEERDPYALDTFDYRMLSRLQSDCKYFLTMGYGYEKHLWTGNVEEQIKKMKEIYEKLPEKPVWCTMDDILAYEKEMKELKAKKNEKN